MQYLFNADAGTLAANAVPFMATDGDRPASFRIDVDAQSKPVNSPAFVGVVYLP